MDHWATRKELKHCFQLTFFYSNSYFCDKSITLYVGVLSRPQQAANVNFIALCCCIIHTFCQSRCCLTAKWGWELLLVFCALTSLSVVGKFLIQWNLDSKMGEIIFGNVYYRMLQIRGKSISPLFGNNTIDILENISSVCWVSL